MTVPEIKQLLEKYKHHTLSDEELLLLQAAVESGQYEAVIREDILRALREGAAPDAGWKQEDAAAMLADILKAEGPRHIPGTGAQAPVIHHKRLRYLVAAAVLVMMIITGGLYIAVQQKSRPPLAARQQHPLAPGSNKAVLTLADGSTIPLDSAGSGTLAQQGNTQIMNANGSLTYRASGQAARLMYNTVSTPRGGQYQLTLADGSRVWLNAASSIRFPTAFTGSERRVEVTGEAYFEVAQNVQQPFKVNVPDRRGGRNVTITVLGTSFNIMAYQDEQDIRTTLVEGAVQLEQNAAGKVLLKPGFRASISPENEQFSIARADIEQELAWKEGRFRFRNTNIRAIMRQLARWYDIEVDYEGNLSDIDLTGVISRRENADALFRALEATQRVRFNINGNKVTVTPYSN